MVRFDDPATTPTLSFDKCKKPSCELVEFDSLPGYLKDNEFILSYYRCEWPLKQTLLSIFSIHNETVNVWTHLIGFLIFLMLTLGAVTMVDHHLMRAEANTTFSSPLLTSFSNASRAGYMIALPSPLMLQSLYIWRLPGVRAGHSAVTNQTNKMIILSQSQIGLEDDRDRATVKPISRWPFIAFLCGAMFCLFTSSACHLLCCHSEKCAYTMLRLDYTGISTLIVTSFYPLVYYTFMCDPFYQNLYISSITIFGIATILGSLVPVFQTPDFRTIRAALFVCMAVSGLVPILHKMVSFGHRPEAVVSTCYEMVMGAFYGLGVVAYATRVPERWMPGKFDLIGHSHQLFHVLVIAGAYTHYLSGLVYLQWRDMNQC